MNEVLTDYLQVIIYHDFEVFCSVEAQCHRLHRIVGGVMGRSTVHLQVVGRAHPDMSTGGQGQGVVCRRKAKKNGPGSPLHTAAMCAKRADCKENGCIENHLPSEKCTKD